MPKITVEIIKTKTKNYRKSTNSKSPSLKILINLYNLRHTDQEKERKAQNHKKCKSDITLGPIEI